jgi:hypothetical protein
VAIDPLRQDGHFEVVRLLGQLGRPREALAQPADVSQLNPNADKLSPACRPTI